MQNRLLKPALMTAMGMVLILAGSANAPRAAAQERDREGGVSGRIVPPGQNPGRDSWSLGVTTETLDTGVRIRDVVNGSAAQRAGLERGDLIVTVEGYQVGRIGGRDYPLDAELNRRADSSGRVRLLVQNTRNNRLTNMDVRLDRGGVGRPERDGIVTGEVTYLTSAPLPRDAELRIRLVKPKLFGKDTIAERKMAIRGAPPHSFELRYPMGKVDPNQTYEVEAEIVVGGRQLYSEDGTYRLRPADSPARLTISMRRG